MEIPTVKVTLHTFGKLMSNRIEKFIKVEELFPNWDKEDEDVEMKIPDDISEALGLEPGDTIRIDVDEKTQTLSLRKVTISVDNSTE